MPSFLSFARQGFGGRTDDEAFDRPSSLPLKIQQVLFSSPDLPTLVHAPTDGTRENFFRTRLRERI